MGHRSLRTRVGVGVRACGVRVCPCVKCSEAGEGGCHSRAREQARLRPIAKQILLSGPNLH